MRYLTILSLTAILVGCQSTTPSSTLGDGENSASGGIDGVYYGGDGYKPGPANGYNPATNGDFYNNSQYGKNVIGGPKAPAKDRVIYFAFDSSNIDQRAEAIVAAHANYLKRNSRTRIILEGHTDSRGSREYNIALGERRALSVKQRFQSQGVNPTQIRIISYGEENPAVSGYNETAYQKNRRAVIQYQ